MLTYLYFSIFPFEPEIAHLCSNFSNSYSSLLVLAKEQLGKL